MNRRIISITGLVLTISMLAGGCSVAAEETDVGTDATTLVAAAETELPVDPSWYRWDPFTAPRSLPKGELFNRELPLPEGIDYAHSCKINEGTELSNDLFDGYYKVDREGHPVSCDCEFFFYDRRLTDEEVEAYDDMLRKMDYACAQSYNGADYHAYTVDGIFMGLKNTRTSDEYPEGRAFIIFVSNQDLKDGFIGVG